MTKILKLGKETLVYGTSTVVARLLNFCLVPFYTYYLLPADYGVVATVFAFLALFNIVYQYGMDQAYLRFTSEEGQDKKESFSTAYICVFFTSLLLSLIIFLSAPFWAKILGIGSQYALLIRLSAGVLLLDALTVIPFAKLRLEHRAWHFVAVRVGAICINVAFNIYFLAVAGKGMQSIFYASLIASAFSLLMLLRVVFEDLRFNFSKPLVKRMIGFAWPFVPSGMASIMVNVIDKPLLIYLAGAYAVGIYQANFKLGVFMMLVVSMFDQAWRPFFLQHAKDENAKPLFAHVFTCFCAVALWILFGLLFLLPTLVKTPIFGKYFINPMYWEGLTIVPFVLTGYFFYGLYINFIVAPILTKRTKILMWVTLLGAAVSVCTNLILVPRIGILGAGYAILLSYISMAAVMFIFTRLYYPIKYQYKRLALLALMAVLMVMVSHFFPHLGVKIALLCAFPFAALAVVYNKE